MNNKKDLAPSDQSETNLASQKALIQANNGVVDAQRNATLQISTQQYVQPQFQYQPYMFQQTNMPQYQYQQQQQFVSNYQQAPMLPQNMQYFQVNHMPPPPHYNDPRMQYVQPIRLPQQCIPPNYRPFQQPQQIYQQLQNGQIYPQTQFNKPQQNAPFYMQHLPPKQFPQMPTIQQKLPMQFNNNYQNQQKFNQNFQFQQRNNNQGRNYQNRHNQRGYNQQGNNYGYNNDFNEDHEREHENITFSSLNSAVYESQDEIKKWVEARKRNYPNKLNQRLKFQEQAMKEQTGELTKPALSILEYKLRKKLQIISATPRKLMQQEKHYKILQKMITKPEKASKPRIRMTRYIYEKRHALHIDYNRNDLKQGKKKQDLLKKKLATKREVYKQKFAQFQIKLQQLEEFYRQLNENNQQILEEKDNQNLENNQLNINQKFIDNDNEDSPPKEVKMISLKNIQAQEIQHDCSIEGNTTNIDDKNKQEQQLLKEFYNEIEIEENKHSSPIKSQSNQNKIDIKEKSNISDNNSTHQNDKIEMKNQEKQTIKDQKNDKKNNNQKDLQKQQKDGQKLNQNTDNNNNNKIDQLIDSFKQKRDYYNNMLDGLTSEINYQSSSFQYKTDILQANLMLDQIYKERNFILQAIRYIVNENFFDESPKNADQKIISPQNLNKHSSKKENQSEDKNSVKNNKIINTVVPLPNEDFEEGQI